MKLTTKRLILRFPEMKDIKSVIKNISNLNVSKWLLAVPYPYTKKDAEWWVDHCAEEKVKKLRKSYEFNLELKSQLGIIGGIGLSNVNLEKGIADIGYWLGEDYWRKGYISEAAKELIDFAFYGLKLSRLRCPTFADNIPSQGLAKSLGFKYSHTSKKKYQCKATGKMHYEKVYFLRRENWTR